MDILDRLFNKRLYESDSIKLREKFRTSKTTAFDGVPTVYYDVLNLESDKVGTIELRLTMEGDMYYYGHVGYNIIDKYRGNNYAYHACELLFKIAREEFNMNELIITCSPENIASYKTLKKLNGELIEEVDVPENHELYMRGEKRKCIFKFRISL